MNGLGKLGGGLAVPAGRVRLVPRFAGGVC